MVKFRIEGSSKRFPTKSFQVNASFLLLQRNSRVAICLRLFQLPLSSPLNSRWPKMKTRHNERTMHQFKFSV